MPEPTHYFDDLAEEIAHGLDAEVDWYAEAIRGGARAPFAAPISEKQKADVFTRIFFKQRPDGTIDWDAPNEDDRAKLMKSGIKNYLDAAKYVMTLRPKTGVRPLNELIEPIPSALPPFEPPPQMAGPIPLGPPPMEPPEPGGGPPMPEMGGPPPGPPGLGMPT